MKVKWVLLCVLGFVAMQALAGEMAVLKTREDMLSYGIGVSVAKNLRQQETEVDMDLLILGLNDGMSGERLLMPEKELRKILNAYQGELRKKIVQSNRVAAEENKKKGDAFLLENKAKDGVVSLPSGLQYKVLKAGDGRMPQESDFVLCNYRGALLNGTEFDGTESGQPATLKVSALINGWKEALKLMPAGSKWQLAIPPQLAYGERGVGGDIGPNETLLFDVELVAIK
jgi:FKBP-type peptidyl-prolyl cis-trans isomerase FklB